jgi:glycosyltransferase involved in cell wall biosynthesis
LNEPLVEILLGALNGEPYIEAQLASLFVQDYRNWRLIVRDDGSADRTAEIIEEWRQRYPEKITVLPWQPPARRGVPENFSILLQASRAPYVMFCDQDDMWHPDKIAVTLAAMQQREAEIGNEVPVLVHTDLRVVDEDLSERHPSFWGHQGLVPHRGHNLGSMLMECIAWGCTCLLNRPLVERVGTIPSEIYHDWWIALTAAAFGSIVSLPKTTIDWRRHGDNTSGTSSLAALLRRAPVALPEMRRRLVRSLDTGQPGGRAFLERYRDALRPADRAAVEAYLGLRERGPVGRRTAILRHRLFFTSWARTLGMLLLI